MAQVTRESAGWHPSLTVFVVMNLLDVASTWMAMQRGLPEGNPVPSMLLEAGGTELMYLFKVAVVLLVVLAALRLSPYFPKIWYGVWIGNAILAVVVTLNVVQILFL